MWRELVDRTGAGHVWEDRAAEALRCRGVVAYPTDTMYGLAADPRSDAAIRKLYRIKGRPVDRATPLIAASTDQLRECGATLTPLAARLSAAFWPGPLTLVIPAWEGLSSAALSGGLTVAVRVPDHHVARTLARIAGSPITSTSANRTTRPATGDPDVVAAELGADLDGLVDDGWCPGGLPSTIVDACGDRPCLVRAGAVPWERVLESER
jgi:L-threonylcarbamoyladenylate synthase